MPIKTYEKLLIGLDLYYISVLTKNPNILTIEDISKIENDYFNIVKVGEFIKPGSVETIYVVAMIIKDIEKKEDVIKSFTNIILDKDYDSILYINHDTAYNIPPPESKYLKSPTIKYWEH